MGEQKERIAIEFISVLGLNPMAFVQVAADLGCRHIGLAVQPIVTCGAVDARWSLRDDAALRHDLVQALRDANMAISVGEGFIALPQRNILDVEPDLDLMAGLGVGCVNMLSADPDPGRAADQCACFADLASDRGMTALLEFLPGMPAGYDLPSALAVVRKVDKPNFKLMIDTMHLFRSGGGVADVAALDRSAIGYLQLCDVPAVSAYANYADEARYDRLSPGDGALPLRDLLKIIPRDVIVGLEVPMRAKAEAGIDARTRLSAAVQTTRAWLAEEDVGAM
jgi:sugar phosphate isomerase/epimerase